MTYFIVPLLQKCARCGLAHADLEFTELKRPVKENRLTYRWWASCPLTGEPILMRQLLDEEAHNAATEEDPRYLSPENIIPQSVRAADLQAHTNGAKSG